jgi:hypothetical protein
MPEDIGKVVTALESGSLVKRLTSAQIAALSSPQKPSGLVVFNTTTGKLQISDGTNFADTDATAVAAQATAAAALPKAGGTMTGNLNMGGQHVLNIGQSGASNDAATVGQVNAVAAAALPKAGGSMSGAIGMGGNYLLNIGQSGAANDAATVGQVNAVQDSVPKGGRALVTFDGSGNAAITHGWGSAPTWAQLTVESPFSVFPHLMSISSTVLNVRASSLSGIITSDSVYMHWLVGV